MIRVKLIFVLRKKLWSEKESFFYYEKQYFHSENERIYKE